MGRAKYGKSVVDGQVRYLSASSLTLADPDSEDGCLRKFWYEKIDGRKPETTGPQSLGVALHSEIENYLRTGLNVLGSLALRGKFMLPEPGKDLFIEHDLVVSPERELAAREAAEGEAKNLRAVVLSDAPLRLLGIPVVGYIDLMHGRCVNKGVSDIEDTVDPEGTVEVIDWKTTSKPDYIKTPDIMARSIQMSLYGKWVMTTLPDTTYVRLSHGYFVTKGSALPRKVSLRVSPEQIGRQWARVEKIAGSIVDVAKELSADKVPANTKACGAYGGCPHRGYCRAASHTSLTGIFGEQGADLIIRRAKVSNTSTTIFGATAELQAEMRRLAREEIEHKYPGVPAAWDELVTYGIGHPEFGGELARVVGDLTGVQRCTHIDGTGELGTYGPFDQPAELPALLDEVKSFIVTKDTNMTTTAPPSQIVELLPPEAPLSRKASDVVLAAHKKGRGRPRKAAAESMAIEASPAATTDTSYDVVINTRPAETLYFYVNCRPSCTYKSLWPVVNEIIDELNRASGDAMDFRLVPNDHAFAYGRWKGVVAVALRSTDLTATHYVLDGVSGEIAITVVETMRAIVASRGGVVVE